MFITPEQLTTQSFTRPFPLSSLLNKLTNKDLILDAEYQRDEVWSTEKKTRLIQSILGGVTIPYIIINENIPHSENKNGVFVNMNCFDSEIIQKIKKYIDYVEKQEKTLNQYESMKHKYQQNYFNKEDKEKVLYSN